MGALPIKDQPPKPCVFPRHVRKRALTTLEKEGVFIDPSGRHQVNGKPLLLDSLLEQKRPAETPLAGSLRHTDPSNIEVNNPRPSQHRMQISMSAMVFF